MENGQWILREGIFIECIQKNKIKKVSNNQNVISLLTCACNHTDISCFQFQENLTTRVHVNLKSNYMTYIHCFYIHSPIHPWSTSCKAFILSLMILYYILKSPKPGPGRFFLNDPIAGGYRHPKKVLVWCNLIYMYNYVFSIFRGRQKCKDVVNR